MIRNSVIDIIKDLSPFSLSPPPGRLPCWSEATLAVPVSTSRNDNVCRRTEHRRKHFFFFFLIGILPRSPQLDFLMFHWEELLSHVHSRAVTMIGLESHSTCWSKSRVNFPLKHVTMGRRGGCLNKSGLRSRRGM